MLDHMEGVNHMKKSHKRLLVGTSIAAGVVGLGAASYAIGKFLMKVALDRTPPSVVNDKSKDKLRGSGEIAALEESLQEAAHKLETCETETVKILARDGTELVGHWRKAPNAKRTIIAMHGWRSTWARDFGLIADFWYRNGCNVLYAEQRGQGSSGGDYMGFGLLERFDCLDWIDWVNERCLNEEPIYLTGISMGASTVLMAAGADLPLNVNGVIADCGFTSPHDIWKHVTEKNLHMTYSLYRNTARDICKRKLSVDPDEYSTIEAMKNCDVPVLFIHGTDDNFVPVEMTYENYKACKAPKHLLIVPGADHGMSFMVDRAAYEKAVLDFWKLYG